MRTLVPVQTLYCSFKDPSLAEEAVGALLEIGLRPQDMGWVSADAYERTALSVPASVIAGSFHGYLKKHGVPEESASQFANELEAGGAMLTINLENPGADQAQAEDILSRYDGKCVRGIDSYTEA